MFLDEFCIYMIVLFMVPSFVNNSSLSVRYSCVMRCAGRRVYTMFPAARRQIEAWDYAIAVFFDTPVPCL